MNINAITLPALLASVVSLSAQSYSIDRAAIYGGGGTSTGGLYSLSGSIGHIDAGHLSGGGFTLHGGFWDAVATVPTNGAPSLSVTCSDAVLLISWPQSAPGWVLECTSALTDVGNSWTLLSPPYPVSGTNFVFDEPSPVGHKFYRLRRQ